MKLYKLGWSLLAGCAAIMPLMTRAQYCTPTVSTTGVYLVLIDFSNASSGFAGGIQHSTTNSGYSVSSSSSGTVKRYFGGSFFYGVANNTPTPVSYNIGVFTDWNNDFDFNDAGEQNAFPIGGVVPGNSSQTTGTSVFPPLNMPSGNYRLRVTASQGGAGTPNPCGPFIGEAEDYTITVAANTAPVLNNASSPVLNTLLTSQTNSNGMSLSELIEYFASGTNMVTDADDNSGANFVNKVPRGIAIYDQSAANGTWQYKIGNGAWTNIGAVSASNALLLLANASNAAYQPNTRMRFVPAGAGTPTLSFKAWDGTNANNGTYGTTATTGGTSAFSVANNTASLPVVASTGYTDNIYVSTSDSVMYKGAFNRTSKTMTNTEPIISGNINYQAVDMELQPGTNKLYWLDVYATDILSSNLDGTGVQTVVSGLNYANGMAIGNNKLYYLDYSSDYSNSIIYKANMDGTGTTAIYTTTGFSDARDMDHYNGRLYYQHSDGTNFMISSVDTTGAGLTTLITSANTMSGLSIKNDTIYWSEGSTTSGFIKKRAISGGTITQLAAETGRTFYDIMVDPATSTVYFTDADANGNGFYTLLRKVATNGTGLSTAATLSGAAYSLAFNGSATIPLPVSLLDLKGNYDAASDQSLLYWSTASEAPNTTYELERSVDGSHFITVTAVKGKGSQAKGFAYNYEDNVSGIDANTLFYRIKEVKANATFQYSKVIALNINRESAAIRLWPNPGKGIFNIQLATVPSAPVSIKVYSTDGRLVTSTSVNSKDYQLDLSDKPTGLYFVQVTFTDGTQKQITVSKE